MVFVGGAYAQQDASHEHYARLTELNLPTVLVNAPVDDLHFATVSCDDSVATAQALNHLRSLGHERIGLLLGPRDHVPSQRKLAAARARLSRAWGAPLDEELVVHSLYSLEAGQAAATRLLAGRGDGDRVRERPDGARRDPGGAAGRAVGAAGRVRSSATTTPP